MKKVDARGNVVANIVLVEHSEASSIVESTSLYETCDTFFLSSRLQVVNGLTLGLPAYEPLR